VFASKSEQIVRNRGIRRRRAHRQARLWRESPELVLEDDAAWLRGAHRPCAVLAELERDYSERRSVRVDWS